MIDIDVLMKTIETIKDNCRATHAIIRRNKIVFVRKISGPAGEKPIIEKIVSIEA